MRLWVGAEMEGKHIGKQTLFAETPYLMDDNLDVIISHLKELKVEALYLGAGRVDVAIVCLEKFEELLKTCWENGIVITIECTNLDTWGCDDELLRLLKEHDIMLVIRHETETEIPLQLLPNFVFKVDDHHFAFFSPFKCKSVTDLKKVSDNMYEGVDRLIYESQED